MHHTQFFRLTAFLIALNAMAASAQTFYSQVYFKEAQGYLLSDSGLVFRSEDGGVAWEGKKVYDSASITGIDFPTQQTGYLVGPGTLLKTLDGGETWTQSMKTYSWLNQVAFLDAQVGVAVGIGIFLRTENGGATWKSTTPGHPLGGVASFWDVAFPAEDAGIMVGIDGWIRKSADKGVSWDSIASPVTEDLLSVHFPTATVGYAVGERGSIVKTVNAGSSWTKQNSGTTSELEDVFFQDAQNGWAVGGGLVSSLMLYTNDGGATWKTRAQPAAYKLSSIRFVDARRGFAAGSMGDLLMTSDGGLTWGRITPAGIRGASGQSRHLVRKSDRIEYGLATPGRVEARLLDVSGRESRVLFAGRKPAGIHSLPLPSSGLATGGYILEFRAAGIRQAIPLRGN